MLKTHLGRRSSWHHSGASWECRQAVEGTGISSRVPENSGRILHSLHCRQHSPDPSSSAVCAEHPSAAWWQLQVPADCAVASSKHLNKKFYTALSDQNSSEFDTFFTLYRNKTQH